MYHLTYDSIYFFFFLTYDQINFILYKPGDVCIRWRTYQKNQMNHISMNPVNCIVIHELMNCVLGELWVKWIRWITFLIKHIDTHRLYQMDFTADEAIDCFPWLIYTYWIASQIVRLIMNQMSQMNYTFI